MSKAYNLILVGLLSFLMVACQSKPNNHSCCKEVANCCREHCDHCEKCEKNGCECSKCEKCNRNKTIKDLLNSNKPMNCEKTHAH
jgi:hypothetical protein